MHEVTWIYALRCPVSNGIRYIGKSNRPEKRLYFHLFTARRGYEKHHAARWLATLLSLNLKPSLEILCQVPRGADWREYERRHIADAIAAGADLTNGTKGGEGVDLPTPQDRERVRLLRKAGFTPDVRARMAASIKRAWADPEVRANQIAKQKAAARVPERKEQLAATARLPRSVEAKARQQAGRAAYWTTERRLQKAAWMLDQLLIRSNKK